MARRDLGLCTLCRIICGHTGQPTVPQLLLINTLGRLVTMDIQLPNDAVTYYPIVTLNAGGQVVPAQAGDTFSVSTTGTAQLAVAIAPLPVGSPDGPPAGTPSVEFTPLVQTATDVPFTVTDADGLTAFDGAVDIVQDLTPKAIGLDLTSPVTTPQPVPTQVQAGVAGTTNVAPPTGATVKK